MGKTWITGGPRLHQFLTSFTCGYHGVCPLGKSVNLKYSRRPITQYGEPHFCFSIAKNDTDVYMMYASSP
jgi:hypothetical protein